MKVKHILLILIIALIFVFFLVNNIYKDKNVYERTNDRVNNLSNQIAIMVEKTAKTGDYESSNLNKWPDDNYIFNSGMSYCEGKSKMSWNEDTRSVTLNTSISDKCYLYFDIYVLPEINSLTINPSDANFTVLINAVQGENPISKYYCGLGSESNTGSDTSSFDYSVSSNTTPYTIYAYVKDSLGKKSKTFVYTLPTISSSLVTSKINSVTVNLSTIKGTNQIVKYFYSKDNGSSYVDSTNNTFTFNDLSEGTSYNLKFYVQDSNGVKSMLHSKQITTKSSPTVPTISFDSAYNIVLSGSTSDVSAVTYYYSTDNKTFTKGNLFSLTSSATIYAYAVDTDGNKSNTVSKQYLISNAQNGQVTTSYYCSHNNSYQSSSSCSNTYTATVTTTKDCTNNGNYLINGECYVDNGYTYASMSDCNDVCNTYDDIHVCQAASYGRYGCYLFSGYPQTVKSYSCPNGGTVSGTNCINNYTGTEKYKCSVTNNYYDSQSEATSACTNYCASGSYYNSKCYKLS